MIETGEIRVCTPDFIRLIHRLFYESLTKDFWIVRKEETGEEQEVVPGDFFTIFIVGGYLMKSAVGGSSERLFLKSA
jgi:hypothetical protein